MIIDAVLNPAEIARLPQMDLAGATCVVFDILRATSSMVTALATGAREIWPVCTIEDALAAHSRMPDALLGGERSGDKIEGFDLGNSPFEYRNLAGRSVISTTTNGTIALRACDHADRVFAGAILNMGALADAVLELYPERLILVCAGTFETFALEDAWAAGRLTQLLTGCGAGEPTDAAIATLSIAQRYRDPVEALCDARNGQALIQKGRGEEVEWCAQESLYPTLGQMEKGAIRPVTIEELSTGRIPARVRRRETN